MCLICYVESYTDVTILTVYRHQYVCIYNLHMTICNIYCKMFMFQPCISVYLS